MNMTPQYWVLLLDFSKREIEKKYRGTFLGIFWVILGPFLLLGVYTLVYSFIMKVKTGGMDRLDFVINLYAGISIFFFFSDVVMSSISCIRNTPNYVKKVIFPLEVLVISKLISALFSFLISFFLLIIFILLKHHTVHITVLFLPIVLLPIIFFSFGLAMALASIGVFMRDIDEIARPLLRVLFYLAPIVYPKTLVPDKFQGFLWFNPLTSMVEHYKQIVIVGFLPEWDTFLIFTIVSLIFLFMGKGLFNKLRPAFADVI